MWLVVVSRCSPTNHAGYGEGLYAGPSPSADPCAATPYSKRSASATGTRAACRLGNHVIVSDTMNEVTAVMGTRTHGIVTARSEERQGRGGGRSISEADSNSRSSVSGAPSATAWEHELPGLLDVTPNLESSPSLVEPWSKASRRAAGGE